METFISRRFFKLEDNIMNYKDKIKEFEAHLIEAEKSKNTIDKYIRDVKSFYKWFDENSYTEVTKETLLEYKSSAYTIRTMY